jgi:TATA-binding protein-associated factor Taf7
VWEKLSIQEVVMLTHIILVMALEPKKKIHLIISNKDSYQHLISKSMKEVRKQRFEKLTSGDHVNYSERTIDIIRS